MAKEVEVTMPPPVSLETMCVWLAYQIAEKRNKQLPADEELLEHADFVHKLALVLRHGIQP